jgi:hypothetical protein
MKGRGGNLLSCCTQGHGDTIKYLITIGGPRAKTRTEHLNEKTERAGVKAGGLFTALALYFTPFGYLLNQCVTRQIGYNDWPLWNVSMNCFSFTRWVTAQRTLTSSLPLNAKSNYVHTYNLSEQGVDFFFRMLGVFIPTWALGGRRDGKVELYVQSDQESLSTDVCYQIAS